MNAAAVASVRPATNISGSSASISVTAAKMSQRPKAVSTAWQPSARRHGSSTLPEMITIKVTSHVFGVRHVSRTQRVAEIAALGHIASRSVERLPLHNSPSHARTIGTPVLLQPGVFALALRRSYSTGRHLPDNDTLPRGDGNRPVHARMADAMRPDGNTFSDARILLPEPRIQRQETGTGHNSEKAIA